MHNCLSMNLFAPFAFLLPGHPTLSTTFDYLKQRKKLQRKLTQTHSGFIVAGPSYLNVWTFGFVVSIFFFIWSSHSSHKKKCKALCRGQKATKRWRIGGRSSDGWRSKKISNRGCDAKDFTNDRTVNISAESQSLDGIWLCILSLPYNVVCQHLTASSITPLSILFAASHAEGDCSTQARGPGVILDFQMHNQTGWQVLTRLQNQSNQKDFSSKVDEAFCLWKPLGSNFDAAGVAPMEVSRNRSTSGFGQIRGMRESHDLGASISFSGRFWIWCQAFPGDSMLETRLSHSEWKLSEKLTDELRRLDTFGYGICTAKFGKFWEIHLPLKPKAGVLPLHGCRIFRNDSTCRFSTVKLWSHEANATTFSFGPWVTCQFGPVFFQTRRSSLK